MAKRIYSHPAFPPARIAEMKALAKKIDAEEGESIRARARAWKANRDGGRDAAAGPANAVATVVAALKTARVEQGLTLDEVGERSGIQKASLSRLENDPEPNPTWDTLARYAAAVGRRIVSAVVKE